MHRRFMAAVVAALSAVVFTSASVTAQWPITCVSLNDIVEGHLGNYHNVGIYQRVYGYQAETACQNDHGDDVRSVFGWAVTDEVNQFLETVLTRGQSVSRLKYGVVVGGLNDQVVPINLPASGSWTVEASQYDTNDNLIVYLVGTYELLLFNELYGPPSAETSVRIDASKSDSFTLDVQASGLWLISFRSPTQLFWGGWPTTCVDLNDIVEAHLGNYHNVGIYQQVFGLDAEAACQGDHRSDVLAVFWWAL